MAETKKTANSGEIDLKEVQAQIAKMLADAKVEAAQIVEAARQATVAGNKSMTPEEMKEHLDYMNEYVEVKLFKDNGKYKDNQVVGVNGNLCHIKRGERIKIKRKFAEVLDNSDKQDYETSVLIEQKKSELEKASKGL